MRLRKTLDAEIVNKIIREGSYGVAPIEEWGDWTSLERKVTTLNFMKDRSIHPQERLTIILREEFLTLDEVTELVNFIVRTSTTCAKDRVRDIDRFVSATTWLFKPHPKSEFRVFPEIVTEALDLLAFNSAIRYASLFYSSKRERFAFARSMVSHALGILNNEEAVCQKLVRILKKREEARSGW